MNEGDEKKPVSAYQCTRRRIVLGALSAVGMLVIGSVRGQTTYL